MLWTLLAVWTAAAEPCAEGSAQTELPAQRQWLGAIERAQEHPDLVSLVKDRRRALGTLAATGGDRDASTAVYEAERQLVLRWSAALEVHRAEAAWLGAARDWNAARCACQPDCEEPTASTTRLLAKVRTLYGQLVDAEQAFLDTYSLEGLSQSIRSSLGGGVEPDLVRLRAASLQAALAKHGAYPHEARRAIADLLASADGAPGGDRDTKQTLVAWTVFGGRWRRHLRTLDKHIERIVKAWGRVDRATARGRGPLAESRLQDAFDALADSNPGAPLDL